MDLQVFRSFVKTAFALQVDASNETPPGYRETRAAALSKYASTARHLIELGGLGTLAAPAVQELRHKPMSEKGKAVSEVAGLGALAAPYAHDLAMKNKSYAGAATKVLSRFHR